MLDEKSELSITYSDVQDGYPGEGNRDFDPLFLDPGGNDFRLRPGSPAAAAGRDGEHMGAYPAVSGASQTFIRGDANGDGGLDITDGVRVLRYLFAGEDAAPCLDALDADDSGGINLTDAVYVLSYLFRGQAAPPAPFPEPGHDPTDADPLGCG